MLFPVSNAQVTVVGHVLYVASLLVGLGIVGLAFYGYRRNGSRSMLLLGCGIATITVVSNVVTIAVATTAGSSLVYPISNFVDLVGFGLILSAIVLARRE